MKIMRNPNVQIPVAKVDGPGSILDDLASIEHRLLDPTRLAIDETNSPLREQVLRVRSAVFLAEGRVGAGSAQQMLDRALHALDQGHLRRARALVSGTRHICSLRQRTVDR